MKVKLATIRKSWIDNDVRKGHLMGLNKYIDITTPISSSTSIYNVTSKPVITSLHTHDLIPKHLNNKCNECNDNPIKIKIPINKIKFGEVGFNYEKYFKNHGVFEGCVMEILRATKSNKNRRCWYSADNDWEDLSIKQLQKLKRVTPFLLSPRKSQS